MGANQMSHVTLKLLLRLISWYLVLQSSCWNTFENESQWLDVKTAHQDIPSNGHQGDIPYSWVSARMSPMEILRFCTKPSRIESINPFHVMHLYPLKTSYTGLKYSLTLQEKQLGKSVTIHYFSDLNEVKISIGYYCRTTIYCWLTCIPLPEPCWPLLLQGFCSQVWCDFCSACDAVT